MKVAEIEFPKFAGIRCLMMPYIQGDSSSVPEQYKTYADILENIYIQAGDIGYLTIDESLASAGKPHRGARARFGRALHTEVGRNPDMVYAWGGGGWGSSRRVTVDADVQILLANNLSGSCAIWDTAHKDTSVDGDIGYAADAYPYEDAIFMEAGEVYQIGILTPHESIPVSFNFSRQFIRIVSSGIHGREEYFTSNPLIKENV